MVNTYLLLLHPALASAQDLFLSPKVLLAADPNGWTPVTDEIVWVYSESSSRYFDGRVLPTSHSKGIDVWYNKNGGQQKLVAEEDLGWAVREYKPDILTVKGTGGYNLPNASITYKPWTFKGYEHVWKQVGPDNGYAQVWYWTGKCWAYVSREIYASVFAYPEAPSFGQGDPIDCHKANGRYADFEAENGDRFIWTRSDPNEWHPAKDEIVTVKKEGERLYRGQIQNASSEKVTVWYEKGGGTTDGTTEVVPRVEIAQAGLQEWKPDYLSVTELQWDNTTKVVSYKPWIYNAYEHVYLQDITHGQGYEYVWYWDGECWGKSSRMMYCSEYCYPGARMFQSGYQVRCNPNGGRYINFNADGDAFVWARADTRA